MKAVNLAKEEFVGLACACGDGPVPFIIRLANDSLTPVMVYANLRDDSEHAFFLESVETGSRVGRYSFMGAHPRKTFSCHDGRFREHGAGGELVAEVACEDPLRALQERMEPYTARWPAELELPPLVGGVVGYLGYDCVHYFEPVGEWRPDELALPEMQWLLTGTVVCFDHLHSHILLSRCVLPEEREGVDLGELYDRLVDDADRFAKRFLRQSAFPSGGVRQALAPKPRLGDYASNHTKESYMAVVERAKEFIHAGEAFQVVPSQRFKVPLRVSALDVYRALRKINPSAYMFALKLAGHEAVGSSPETQLRCQQGHLMMRPLAGTRPITGDAAVDAQSARELLADAKELAEHSMLIDLVRNDLGRVAEVGSVRLVRQMEVEKYSHVMHITSEVVARMDGAYSVYDALRATFPAGTLSGAPKVRAMQLINVFEPVRRNMYGGLVGYIDFAGNCDSCIAIRMMVAHDGNAHVQAGGGLVADSEPAAEYHETVSKASAVLLAIAQAEAGQ